MILNQLLRGAIVLIILLAFIAIGEIFFGGAYKKQMDQLEMERRSVGRFQVIETFQMFDGIYAHSGDGQLLRDRKTGACYLYYWGGSTHGGPALTAATCNVTK